MHRKTQISGFGLLAVFGASCVLHGQTVPQTKEPRVELSVEQKAVPVEAPKVTVEKPMSFWMTTKLNSSKSILEGLTKGDFEKLERDAGQMLLIGKLEGFVRRSNPAYKSHLHTFELANQELIRQAKRHNAEGAALAFNQLTSSCVACHVMLREGVE